MSINIEEVSSSPVENKEEIKSSMLDKVAQVITRYRKDVENSLVATGSPTAVRLMSKSAFNSEVVNRLSDRSANGEQFREDMAKVIVLHDTLNANNRDFFTESKASSSGMGLDLPPVYTGTIPTTANVEISPDMTLLDYQETETGDVRGKKERERNTSFGEILTGSASVISSVTGLMGLFVGDQNQQMQQDELNFYAQQYQQPQPKRGGMNRRTIIIGLVVVALIVAVVVISRKKS